MKFAYLEVGDTFLLVGWQFTSRSRDDLSHKHLVKIAESFAVVRFDDGDTMVVELPPFAETEKQGTLDPSETVEILVANLERSLEYEKTLRRIPPSIDGDLRPWWAPPGWVGPACAACGEIICDDGDLKEPRRDLAEHDRLLFEKFRSFAESFDRFSRGQLTVGDLVAVAKQMHNDGLITANLAADLVWQAVIQLTSRVTKKGPPDNLILGNRPGGKP